jgi:hypothetical protein
VPVLPLGAAGYPARVRSLAGLVLLFGCGCASASAEPSAPSDRDRDADHAPAAAEPSNGDEREGPAARPLPRMRTGDAWADCYRTFVPSEDPVADLSRLAQACAGRAHLVPATPVHTGSQREHDPSDRLALRAARGRCYRAFAVGAPSIVDLDVAIFDPSHNLISADISRDRWSVVPTLGPMCAPRGGLYTLEIAVTAGAGDYVAQVWGSPDPDEEEDSTP